MFFRYGVTKEIVIYFYIGKCGPKNAYFELSHILYSLLVISFSLNTVTVSYSIKKLCNICILWARHPTRISSMWLSFVVTISCLWILSFVTLYVYLQYFFLIYHCHMIRYHRVLTCVKIGLFQLLSNRLFMCYDNSIRACFTSSHKVYLSNKLRLYFNSRR